MTRKQKAELRQSELRSKLNEFSGKESLTAEETGQVEKLEGELRAAEVEFRAAVREEADDKPADPQESALERRLDLRRYVSAALEGQPFDGAEAEFVQHRNLPAGEIPLEAIAPRPDAPERRADSTTNAPTSTGQSQRQVLQRVFANTSAMFLGVRFDSVPSGASVYPVLSSGQDAKRLAAGGDFGDIGAATIAATTLKPVRSQAAYSIRHEDAAVFGQSLESSLRSDMSGALAEQMDRMIIDGNGTAPNPTGLWSATTAPTDGTDIVTFQSAVSSFASAIDGRYAMTRKDLRVVVAPDLYAKLAELYTVVGQNFGYVSALDALEMKLGGLQVSAHAPAASSDNAHAVVRLGKYQGAAVAAIWPSVRLIRDEVTESKSGRVNLTMVSLWNFALLRAASFKRLTFHLA